MKRPFALVGITCLLTLSAAAFLPIKVIWFAAGFVFCCFLAAIFIPRFRHTHVFPLAFFVVFCSLIFYAQAWNSMQRVCESLDGQDVFITAVPETLTQKRNGKFYYDMQVKKLQLKNGKVLESPKKIRLSSQMALRIQPFDTFYGKIHCFLPPKKFRPYYCSVGEPMLAFLYEFEPIHITPCKKCPWYAFFLKAREKSEKFFLEILPKEEAGLMSGILLGDKGGVPKKVIGDFRRIGVSHMLAVSGLHLSVMMGFTLLILKAIRCPQKWIFIPYTAVLFFCMAITGFSASVMRSGLMLFFMISAQVLGRRSDSLNSLGIAVLILCLANPFSGSDVGLVLSFAATLGIILFENPIYQNMVSKFSISNCVLRKLQLSLCSITSVTLSAMVFTVPLEIMIFGEFSIMALPANLLLTAPCAILLASSALCALLGTFKAFSILAMPFGLVSGLLALYMKNVAALLAKVPFASVPASYGFIKLWVAMSILLFATSFLLCPKKTVFRITAWLCVFLCICGVVSNWFATKESVEIEVSAGSYKSCSVSAASHFHGAVLWSCGSVNSSEDFLRAENVQAIDYCPGSKHHGEIWKNLQVCAGAHSVYFTSNGISCLVCDSECDVNQLPSNQHTPQILILSQKPKNWQKLTSSFIVWAGKGKSVPKELLALSGKGICVEENEAIYIRCTQKHTLELRRKL